MRPTIKNISGVSINNDIPTNFGKKVGVFAALFGCWHDELSRPFTIGKESYRVCLLCGARRHFDPRNLKTFGAFYYPPTLVQAGEKMAIAK